MLSFGPLSSAPLSGFSALFPFLGAAVDPGPVIVNVPIADSSGLASMLEAVNIILRNAGESMIDSMDVHGLAFVDNAVADLLEASRLVQSVGYKFNSEDCYPLVRDANGLITLPSNTLKCDVDDCWNYKVRAQQRGVRLYDSKAHSYQFQQDLTARMVFLLGWDELPQAARQYITIKAARTYQARDFGSTEGNSFVKEDEQAAWLALSDYESDTGDYNMLTDSRSVSSVLFGREQFAY